MSKTEVIIAGVKFKNPVITASGTFGYGKEYSEFIDLSKLGGVTTKGVSNVPWHGNDTPRIAETHGGMLNSIGLQNNGVKEFIETAIPFLRKYKTNIIVNICGHTTEEYVEVAKALSTEDVDMLELNISCPNVSQGGIAFGQDERLIHEVVSEVKKASKHPLIVKLSPNVTDIGSVAKCAENAGADVISLINTLIGMKIDIKTRKPMLKNKIGGLSGPCIKPIAVRMVYQAAKAVNIPVIGMGGIMNTEDALEFLMAGATCVAVGTANFTNPYATVEIIDGINKFMNDNKIKDINEIIKIID